MTKARFLQQVALSSLLFCSAHTTFANPVSLTACPSVEALQSFAFGAAIPIGFDAQENKVRYLTISVGGTPQLKDYGLFLSPVEVIPGTSPETNIHEQLVKLHSTSDTPISNNIFITDEINEPVQMCTYSSEDNTIHAILYVEENSEEGDVNYSNIENKAAHQAHPGLLKFALGHQ